MVETDESETKNQEVRKVNMGQFNLLSSKGGAFSNWTKHLSGSFQQTFLSSVFLGFCLNTPGKNLGQYNCQMAPGSWTGNDEKWIMYRLAGKGSTKAEEPAALEVKQDEKKETGDSDTSDDDDGKEQMRIMKQLQFPEIEANSTFSPDMCPKITRCLQKRLDKIQPIIKALDERGTLSNVLSVTGAQFPHLTKFCFSHCHVTLKETCQMNSPLQRLKGNLEKKMKEIDNCMDQIQTGYTDGLVNGFGKIL